MAKKRRERLRESQSGGLMLSVTSSLRNPCSSLLDRIAVCCYQPDVLLYLHALLLLSRTKTHAQLEHGSAVCLSAESQITSYKSIERHSRSPIHVCSLYYRTWFRRNKTSEEFYVCDYGGSALSEEICILGRESDH